MNLTVILWLAFFAGGTILALRRPVWGLAVYMLTFFASPPFWWWGDVIEQYRWNLFGGIVLLIAVVLSRFSTAQSQEDDPHPMLRRIGWIMGLILLNATLVHIALAKSMAVSESAYFLLAKFVLLFFMIILAIRDRDDLRTALLVIVLGAAYIGYEATVNDRGRIESGRLEGVGAPGAVHANELASLLVTILPATAALLWIGRWWEKGVAVLAAPLILNVILLCNSRGAFLAAIASAGIFLIGSPKQIRKQALQIICLGGIGVFMLLGDSRILERFATIFVSKEERDSSATSRLTYWKAGFRMIADYPLGAGGDGFKRVHGPKYIAAVSGEKFEARSVHNGYINEACEWGIQGLILRLGLVMATARLLWKSTRVEALDPTDHIVACALLAGLGAFVVTCVFGDRLDAEWGYWMSALAIAHCRIVFLAQGDASDVTKSDEIISHDNVFIPV